MTNGSDPIESAIADAARGMTAHTAPDLRARVAARLPHPGVRFGWWQPAVTAAALAAIVVALWWAASQPADPPAVVRADIQLAPPAQASAAVPLPPIAVRTPPRQEPVDREPAPWPELEYELDPLALAALTLEPFDAAVERPAPVDVAPLDVPPLTLEPLAEPDLERRR